MSFVHLDNPGEIRWLRDRGPVPVLGACPHSGCRHNGTTVIAWGPDMRHYELIECGLASLSGNGCGGECRAWTDERGRVTTPWLHVAVTADQRSDLQRA